MSETSKHTALRALAGSMAKKKGYDIDELRYQMAIKELQKELCKEKLLHQCGTAMNEAPWSRKGEGGALRTGILGTVMKGLSYSDYILLGISAFKTTKNIFSFFKRKK